MSNRDEKPTQSLISQNEVLTEERSQTSNNKRTAAIAITVLVAIGLIILVVILSQTLSSDIVPPKTIQIPLLNGTTTMKIGTSRVLQVLFFSGNDNRTSDDYQTVTQKQIHWRATPEGIISVDPYGRIEALSLGKVTIKVVSGYDAGVSDYKDIEVVENQKMVSNQTRIINYSGPTQKMKSNYQKIVDRMTKDEVASIETVPQSIKQVSANPKSQNKKTKIEQGGVIWQIINYVDGSNRTYIKRTQKGAPKRDEQQYFMGDRYLPGTGHNVISIQNDNNNGIWTVQENGTATNIKMLKMSSNKKAEMMTNDTKQNVMRHGFASDASRNGTHWIPTISDNDGLWTGMYGAGQLMKYASLKKHQASQEEIKLARNDAIKSLKAVLLAAHASGRNGTVDAKIRRFNSSRNQVYLSSQYLKKGKVFNIDNYPGSPADGVGLFGQFAGRVIDGAFEGGKQVYTYKPEDPEDWTQTEEPALTKRTLNGYVSRTFVIPAVQGNKTTGGLFFSRNSDGTQTVLSGANALYDYKSTDHPTLDLGNLELPQVLSTIASIDGRPLKGTDLLYKGDTSTDSLIGHLFIYKIAFDVLDDSDAQERALKQLVAETMVNLAQMFINNGYNHVDATGQGTKWTRMHRDFFLSDYTLEDSPLKAIQTLLIFKLTFYVTGDEQWKKQYDLLVNHQSFDYANQISTLWQRWVWRAFNQDAKPSAQRFRLDIPQQNISKDELIRHVMYDDHYSDDEQALLAFYLIFQLQDDGQLLKKYKQGLNGYWQAISRSQNSLWYLIYQLTQPNNSNSTDYFGNNIIETAAWALSRQPIDTTGYSAFVLGSRKDVIFEGILSANPSKVVDTRKSKADQKYANISKNYEIDPEFNPANIYEINPLPPDERSLHKFNGPTFTNIDTGNKNTKEAATLFTLPYWLGVYHNMIEFDP